LARSLFLYGLCNGHIQEGTPIIEASSGSTAISEAYFARMLGLPFIAVMPKRTSEDKVAQIAFYEGQSHFVEQGHQMYLAAQDLAKEQNGYYMDQFTFAERATDWRGNNNVADSMFDQMAKEQYPEPTWVVVSAGTGGTSSTIGRYIRYKCLKTKLCVVDPQNSVFHPYYQSRDATLISKTPSLIEGIGRPRVEPSFQPDVIDRMMTVKDEASVAAMLALETWIGKACGGSTGTNLIGTLVLASEMQRQGQAGSIVTLICDSGERYRKTLYDESWLDRQGLNPKPVMAHVKEGAQHLLEPEAYQGLITGADLVEGA